jgi:hypothetical protein
LPTTLPILFEETEAWKGETPQRKWGSAEVRDENINLCLSGRVFWEEGTMWAKAQRFEMFGD